jgi:hypothetical protein
MSLGSLGSDLFGHVLSFVLSHKTLCHVSPVCRSWCRVATSRILQAYTEESVTWERIIDKLHLHEHARCTCLGRYDDKHPPRIKSVELLKHALGWDDREPTSALFRYSPNDRIRMAFFCDCRGCTHEHLVPCGRGESSVLSEHEQTHIVQAFQVTWWDELDESYVFASSRLAVAG